MSALAPYAKAVVGFIAPAAVVLTSSVLTGSDGGSAITQAEAVTAACACIITAAAVWRVPNKPANPAPGQDVKAYADAPEHRAM